MSAIYRFLKACDSIKKGSLYDILNKFGVPNKLVGLIKTCVDGIQSKMRIKNICLLVFPLRIV